MTSTNKIILGDAKTALQSITDNSIDMCVTSPPYFNLRDYGVVGQIGLEDTPEDYINNLVDVFREVRRVLTPSGTLWVNIGDSFAGGSGRWGGNTGMNSMQLSNSGSLGQIGKSQRWQHETIKQKDLIGIPWMLAFALRADGWYLRQDIIWSKPNPMPESVKDRCTKSHEYIFLLSKSSKYFYDYKAISEKSAWSEKDKRAIFGLTQSKKASISQYQCKRQGVYNKDGLRNKRDVWTVKAASFKDAHFATFPQELVIDCIKAGCPEGGIVLDPFMGSGTTAVVSRKTNRNYIGIELNPEYVAIAEKRLYSELGVFQ